MEKISNKHLEIVCKIFEVADSHGDIKDLLIDVCTSKELETIFQRFKVAQMLKNGMTFNQIEGQTGISSTTIARVSKCLQKGSGYKKLLGKYNLSFDIDE